MSRKILLISALVTVTYWIGGAIGCSSTQQQEKNYRVLNEDKPRFTPTQDPNKPGESMAPPPSDRSLTTLVKPTIIIQSEEEELLFPGLEANPIADDIARHSPFAAAPLPASSTLPASTSPATAPAPTALDRSRWSHITVGPADGSVIHQPVYFHDVGELSPKKEPADPVKHAMAVSPRAGKWDAGNAFTAAVDPLKFFFDFITHPVMLIVHPPWSEEVSR